MASYEHPYSSLERKISRKNESAFLKSYTDECSVVVSMADCCFDDHHGICGKLKISTTSPDIEIIKAAYLKWGEDCPNHLLGDFAFSLWDQSKNKLFCSRDPLGVKPLLFACTPTSIVVSTSLDEIIIYPNVSSRLDESFVAAYLSDKYFSHNSRTFYEGVEKVPAGHSLTLVGGRVSVTRHWCPDDSPDIRFSSMREYSEALLALYERIMPDYVGSSGRIGVNLSGGIDSSSVAVLASRELARQGREKPKAYSWHPSPSNSGHLPGQKVYGLINAVCDQESLTPEYCFPSVKDIEDFYLRSPFKQPLEANLLHEFSVMKKAQKEGVKIILSGVGGDQCVTNNGLYFYSELLRSGQFQELIKEGGGFGVKSLKLITRAAFLLMPSTEQRKIRKLLKGKFLLRDETSFISKKLKGRKSVLHDGNNFHVSSVKEHMVSLLQQPFFTERLESYAHGAAEYGVAYRYPLLDRRLIEFALGLPPELYRYQGSKRWVARSAFDSILPESVCWNTDKSDDLLASAVNEVLPSVLSRVIPRLKMKQASHYADYVSVSSLIEKLESKSFQSDPRMLRVHNALLFINSDID